MDIDPGDPIVHPQPHTPGPDPRWKLPSAGSFGIGVTVGGGATVDDAVVGDGGSLPRVDGAGL